MYFDAIESCYPMFPVRFRTPVGLGNRRPNGKRWSHRKRSTCTSKVPKNKGLFLKSITLWPTNRRVCVLSDWFSPFLLLLFFFFLSFFVTFLSSSTHCHSRLFYLVRHRGRCTFPTSRRMTQQHTRSTYFVCFSSNEYRKNTFARNTIGYCYF